MSKRVNVPDMLMVQNNRNRDFRTTEIRHRDSAGGMVVMTAFHSHKPENGGEDWVDVTMHCETSTNSVRVTDHSNFPTPFYVIAMGEYKMFVNPEQFQEIYNLMTPMVRAAELDDEVCPTCGKTKYFDQKEQIWACEDDHIHG